MSGAASCLAKKDYKPNDKSLHGMQKTEDATVVVSRKERIKTRKCCSPRLINS
jgi:hypothetical protein